MAYTVLARRYRSGTFDEVIGQDHVAQTLKKAIASGRIAHAYLFCGTRGVGKTSMARILAKALNCQKSDGPTTEPCGECESCKAIARGDDIDVIEIDAASNTGVDNVREVIENSAYRPARSRFKIYIIDEAHMLSKQAFNALLKTLEEPPSHVKFILATTEAEKLLPTILSRCQRYDFRNIPTREIAAHLADLCKREKIEADDDALMLVAKAGAGSMRDSLSLLDRLLSIGEKHLTADMIERLLGLPKSQLLFDLAESIGAGDVKAVLGQANAIVQGGLSVDSLIVALVDHLRNLLILRTCGADSELVEAPGLAAEDLSAQANRFDPAALAQDITILEELRRTLRQSQAGRALLDATLVRLALADQFASIGDLLARLDGGESSPSPARAPARTTPPAQKKNSDGIERSTSPSFREEGRSTDSSRTPSPFKGEGSGEGASRHKSSDAVLDQASSPPRIDEPRLEPILAVNDSPAPEPSPSKGEGAGAESIGSPSFDDDADGADDLPAPGKVWSGPSESLSTLMAKHRASSSVATPAPVAVASPATQVTGLDIASVDPRTLATVWQAMLEILSKQGPMLHSLVSQGQLVGIDDGRLIIRFAPKHETFVKQWEKNGKRDLIRDAASQAMNRSVGVKFEIDAAAAPAIVEPAAPPAGPHRSATSPSAPPPEQAPMPETPAVKVTSELIESLAAANPLIKAAIWKLGAQVIKVE
ncbi:MAG TPA: DNA polymerase III subunit gamma/tau [Tepidisphaeraceae bacterium]|jgi:DNA polymerase-3 subunit gamma/tau|nr:DNA polymerase III subunit gamma/tau [Tepidisphaeraceae bacterium]